MKGKRLEVAERKCTGCLFGAGKLVSEARRRQLLEQCRRRDVPFLCHEGLPRRVVCRGWWETFSCTATQVLARLGLVYVVQAASGALVAGPGRDLAHAERPHQGTLAHGMRRAKRRRGGGDAV